METCCKRTEWKECLIVPWDPLCAQSMLYDLGLFLAEEQFPTLKHSEEEELNFDSIPPP